MDRVLLLVAMVYWSLSGVSPQCDMINISIPLEREECGKCIMIDVASCAGFCLTQDPVYKSSLIAHAQNSCSISEVTYKTVHLPDCPEGVDPTVSYPVPLSCKCDQCSVESTDCSSFHMLSCQTH
ncbi:follitropin subunit beta [Brienomyrus brachyistius]|uniref:follitropin subunit beta n=1 Tax=Brienomyrus brachyistius TaxID=42636 RepID=UPI0020B2A546|nr:follitropin subunit beta [Brienomyrus brachyistius]